jgi:hypothetical protein
MNDEYIKMSQLDKILGKSINNHNIAILGFFKYTTTLFTQHMKLPNNPFLRIYLCH